MEKPSVFWRHFHTWPDVFLPSFNLLFQTSLIFIPGVESQLQNVDELFRCCKFNLHGMADVLGLQISELATQSSPLVFYAVWHLTLKFSSLSLHKGGSGWQRKTIIDKVVYLFPFKGSAKCIGNKNPASGTTLFLSLFIYKPSFYLALKVILRTQRDHGILKLQEKKGIVVLYIFSAKL